MFLIIIFLELKQVIFHSVVKLSQSIFYFYTFEFFFQVRILFFLSRSIKHFFPQNDKLVKWTVMVFDDRSDNFVIDLFDNVRTCSDKQLSNLIVSWGLSSTLL